MRAWVRRATRKVRLIEWQAVVTHTPARVTEAATLGYLGLSPWSRFLRWQRAVAYHWWSVRELAPNEYGAGRMSSRGVEVDMAPEARDALFPWAFLERLELIWGLPETVVVILENADVVVILTMNRLWLRRRPMVTSQARRNGLTLTIQRRSATSWTCLLRSSVQQLDGLPSARATRRFTQDTVEAQSLRSDDPSVRVKMTTHEVIKLRRRELSGPKPGGLIDEFRALERLAPHPSFMTPVSYHVDQHIEVLTQSRADGLAAATFWAAVGPERRACLIASLADAASWAVHRGVEHRDWTADNVLVNTRGGAQVIDLDQGVLVAPTDAVRNVLPRRYLRRLVPWNHYDELIESLDSDGSTRMRLRALGGRSGRRDRDSYLTALYDERWHALCTIETSWRDVNWRVHGEDSALVGLLLWAHGAEGVDLRDARSRSALEVVLGPSAGSGRPSLPGRELWLGQVPREAAHGALVVVKDGAGSPPPPGSELRPRGACCGHSTFEAVAPLAREQES